MIGRLNTQKEIKDEKIITPILSKSELLKVLEKKTGRKSVYKKWSIEELSQRIESLNMEEE